MSILRDLDPQNARFSERTTAAKSRKMLWAMALILLLVAATWLFWRAQTNKNVSSDERASELASTTNENDSGSGNRNSAAGANKIESEQPPSTAQSALLPSDPTKAGAALIQTSTLSSQPDGKQDKNAGPNVFQTMQMELEKSRDEQPATKEKLTDTSMQEKPHASGKPATTGTRKSAGHSTTDQRVDSAQQLKNTKTPKERDIEIVTAIVK